MNNLIAGDDDHTRELARLLGIDLNNRAQKTFTYTMEFMKYGNMNVYHLQSNCGLLSEVKLFGPKLCLKTTTLSPKEIPWLLLAAMLMFSGT